MLVFRAKIHKNAVIIANGEDSDHTDSYLGLHCLSIVLDCLAGKAKKTVMIANWLDPGQTASSEVLVWVCTVLQATSV